MGKRENKFDSGGDVAVLESEAVKGEKKKGAEKEPAELKRVVAESGKDFQKGGRIDSFDSGQQKLSLEKMTDGQLETLYKLTKRADWLTKEYGQKKVDLLRQMAGSPDCSPATLRIVNEQIKRVEDMVSREAIKFGEDPAKLGLEAPAGLTREKLLDEQSPATKPEPVSRDAWSVGVEVDQEALRIGQQLRDSQEKQAAPPADNFFKRGVNKLSGVYEKFAGWLAPKKE